VTPVLITYLHVPGEVDALAREAGMEAVQLHGPAAPEELAGLRRLEPGRFLMKSLVVGRGGPGDVFREMAAAAPHVDAFLLDTFDPATGACGATGRVHDWAVSRALVERSQRPVVLAGGLTPDNVARAVRRVGPAGVDAHTGLEEASGRKSEALVRRFVERSRVALRSVAG
jgi:phosphoribosylanthranilate isomerase